MTSQARSGLLTMDAVPELFTLPIKWAATGALVLTAAVLGVACSGDSGQPALTGPELTGTVSDLADDGPLTGSLRDLTDSVGDIEDASAADPGGAPLTGTVHDADTTRPGTQLRAQVIADEFDECLWLVNIPGQNPAKLFLGAWPTGTEISWDPFYVELPGVDEVLDMSRMVISDGDIVDNVAFLTPDEHDRLQGMDRCEHDAVVVFPVTAEGIALG